jgi:BlaI family transcriptional regulator, penicillinase repressor
MSRHCAAASLTRRERQILRIIWRQETSSIRSILEALPVDDKPAYTTIQTIVHRLARKGAVRRAGRKRNADLFVAAIARSTVVRQWIDDCMALAEGHEHLVVSHLANYGFRAADVEEQQDRASQRQDRFQGDSCFRETTLTRKRRPLWASVAAGSTK